MPEYTTNYGLIKPLDNETADIAVVNQNMDIIDSQMKQNANAIETHLAESMIHAAGGTANAVVVATGGDFDYVLGAYLKFKAVADNTGNMTIDIDGKGIKALKKIDGSQIPAGGIKTGKVYEVYYDSGGDCFFLLARADGDAVAGDVLAEKTFSNNDDTGITGTMPNIGQQIIIPSNTDITISKGYHNGTGKVNFVTFDPSKVLAETNIAGTQGTMVDRGTINITPGTGDITIPQGYHSGAGVVYGDADLVAGNIKSGVNLFGVTGNVVQETMGKIVYGLGSNVASFAKRYDDSPGSTGVVTNTSENLSILPAETSYTVVAATANPIDITPYTYMKLFYGHGGDTILKIGLSTVRDDNSLNIYSYTLPEGLSILRKTLGIGSYNGLYYIKVVAQSNDSVTTDSLIWALFLI